MSEIKLLVNKRANDIHVCLANDTAVWECGKTVAEAVGKLMQTHGADLGVLIMYPTKLTDGVPDAGLGELTEDELFAFANGLTGRPMTQHEREWCLDEISSVEGHERKDYVACDNKQLARSVLSAWVDFCRDKGTL